MYKEFEKSNPTFKTYGTEYIQSLVYRGTYDGTHSAVVRGNWEISSAIILPSDFTLTLESCHLRMKDGVFDNMFRNANGGDSMTRIAGKGDKNIKIIGKGNVILDGGMYNGLSEFNAGKNGRPHMWVNNVILFAHVDGFEVRNLHIRNQRYWAMNFAYCSDGIISDIDFYANDTAIDVDGNEYYCLDRDKGPDVLVKNADGIDLRSGCHDIVIQNITGFTEDDFIALNAIRGKKEPPYYTPDKKIDICNIKIKNIRGAAYCSMIRLLSQGGMPLHDIEIEDVYDTSAECESLIRGGYGIRVGDGRCLYGTRHATEDETYNISIKNVRSRAKDGALHLGGGMKNITIENVKGFDGTIDVDDCREMQ